MSSTYHVFCLSHDPAQITDRDYRTPEEALAAARQPDQHPRCDVLIGRMSGDWIEVGCPPTPREHPPGHLSYHPRSTEWVDADWLRLMLTVLELPADTLDSRRMKRALRDIYRRCWPAERVQKLRPYLLDREDA